MLLSRVSRTGKTYLCALSELISLKDRLPTGTDHRPAGYMVFTPAGDSERGLANIPLGDIKLPAPSASVNEFPQRY
jgi:hypothetical protein